MELINVESFDKGGYPIAKDLFSNSQIRNFRNAKNILKVQHKHSDFLIYDSSSVHYRNQKGHSHSRPAYFQNTPDELDQRLKEAKLPPSGHKIDQTLNSL